MEIDTINKSIGSYPKGIRTGEKDLFNINKIFQA